MDCSLPDSSVQASLLEWVAISFSRWSSWLRDWTQVSCTAGGFFTNWNTREAHLLLIHFIHSPPCYSTGEKITFLLFNNNSSSRRKIVLKRYHRQEHYLVRLLNETVIEEWKDISPLSIQIYLKTFNWFFKTQVILLKIISPFLVEINDKWKSIIKMLLQNLIEITSWIRKMKHFPGGSDGKESACSGEKWCEVKSLSHVWFFATLRTADCHTPPSMGVSRQEYGSGLPFVSPEDLPNPGILPGPPAL